MSTGLIQKVKTNTSTWTQPTPHQKITTYSSAPSQLTPPILSVRQLSPGRPIFFAAVFEKSTTVGDTSCFCHKLILPTDLVDCTGSGELDFTDFLTFGTGQSLDQVELEASITFNQNSRLPYTRPMQSVIQGEISNLIDADLVEMLILSAITQTSTKDPYTVYSPTTWLGYETGMKWYGMPSMKKEDYFKKITHDGVPGYYLNTDHSDPIHFYGEEVKVINVGPSFSFTYHFFLTKTASLMTQAQTELEITFKTKHRKSNSNLHLWNYKISISHAQATDNFLTFKLLRENGSSNAFISVLSQTLTIQNINNWVHFGLILGHGVLFHPNNNQIRVKRFETIFGQSYVHKQESSQSSE